MAISVYSKIKFSDIWDSYCQTLTALEFNKQEDTDLSQQTVDVNVLRIEFRIYEGSPYMETLRIMIRH